MAIKDRERKNAYQREYYARSKRTQESSIRRAKLRRARLTTWWKEYKKQFQCAHCPEDHPACIDFHHTNPAEKDTEIGDAISRNWGIDRVLKEIKKCIPLCANCHRKVHWEWKEKAREQ